MPVQCPACARFLSMSLVAGLAETPAPCPKCGTTLTSEMFDDGAAVADTTASAAPNAAAEPPAAESAPDASPAASVRPPDLPPSASRPLGDARDPLAGWDEGGEVVDAAAWRRERGVDALEPGVLAAIAALVGALLGALVSSRRRGRGALLGALVAALAAAVAGGATRRD